VSEKRASALPDADTLELVFHAALRAGDTKGIEAALRLLTIQDPARAEELFKLLRVALAIAADKQIA